MVASLHDLFIFATASEAQTSFLHRTDGGGPENCIWNDLPKQVSLNPLCVRSCELCPVADPLIAMPGRAAKRISIGQRFEAPSKPRRMLSRVWRVAGPSAPLSPQPSFPTSQVAALYVATFGDRPFLRISSKMTLAGWQ